MISMTKCKSEFFHLFLRLNIIAFIFLFSYKATSQHLTEPQVRKIAASLVNQKILTPFGAEELIRYAAKKPLQVYENCTAQSLSEIDYSYYFLNNYFDILPGRENLNQSYLDSLLQTEKYKYNDREVVLEESFLLQHFPTKHHLMSFIYHAALFCKYNKRDIYYDKTEEKVVKKMSTYFGSSMSSFFKDKDIEFSVSSDNDTKAKQDRRVLLAKPFLKWVPAFKAAGLLAQNEMRIENKYADGVNIFTTINHHEIITEISKLITYNDKYPFYKNNQLALLDSFVTTGLISKEQKSKLISLYKENNLLTINDVIKQSGKYILAAPAQPANANRWSSYNEFDTEIIKQKYAHIIKEAAKLLHFQYADLSVMKEAVNEETELLMMPGGTSSDIDMYVTINGRLYKEVIQNLESHHWLSGINFQFLNHFLEDEKIEKRFYFVKPAMFTGYENEHKNDFIIALLSEKEAEWAANKYMASNLDACYNGSPGNYSYSVTYGYHDTAIRLTRANIIDAANLFIQEGVIKNMSTDQRNKWAADMREKNPETIANVLFELPNTFNCDPNPTIGFFIETVNNSLLYDDINPENFIMNSFIKYQQTNKQFPATEEMIIGFSLNNKIYESAVESERDAWDSLALPRLINKAFQDQGMPYKILLLNASSLSLPQNVYGKCFIMLTSKQAEVLEKKYQTPFRNEYNQY